MVEIKQISAYSCRGMVGAGTNHISEHAFGNALDIAAFTLADGRKISVQHGWRGTPEEQGFLHDVQLYACDTFVTVLAPGYNAAHYNHIHVDLMRRANGRRPCQPKAVPGEIVAAKARAVYASRGKGPAYTGSIKAPISIGTLIKGLPEATPGEDGFVDSEDDDDTTGSIGEAEAPAKPASGTWFSRLFSSNSAGKNAARAEQSQPEPNYGLLEEAPQHQTPQPEVRTVAVGTQQAGEARGFLAFLVDMRLEQRLVSGKSLRMIAACCASLCAKGHT